MRHVPALLLIALTACATHDAEAPAPTPEAVVVSQDPIATEPVADEAKPAETAADAGVLGSLEGDGNAPLKLIGTGGEGDLGGGGLGSHGVGQGGGGLAGGLGGLIGESGTVVGSGGLGSRGTGLGGLGTKGLGSGKSGYGTGGGTFGSAALVPRREGANTEQYTDHGVNGHVLAEADSRSTFSIDVDTASWAIARRYLDGGDLPPQAAVRVEEFVNALKYGDPAPTNGAPFAVTMEAAPDPFLRNHHVLRIGVKAAQPPITRDPVHLTFLVDTSGSMRSQDKLPLAQQALRTLVEQLDGEDRVALVTYAGDTRVVLEPTRASDRARITAAIDQLQSGGGTGMSSGMQLAYELALRTLEPGTENRVIVLSDGDANIGAASHEAILDELAAYAKKGITLSTIGFGRGNYKDTLMEQLADRGDGNYHYIDTLAEAKKVFGTDLAGTVVTVARDVKIQVDFDPATVLSYRLIGYENRDIADVDFRNDAVDAGEIGSGHTVTALYDLVLRDDRSDTLATVRMRSKPPGPDAPAIERVTTLPASAIRSEFASSTADFRIAWTGATFAEMLRGSPYVEEVTWDALRGVGRAARRGPQDDELLRLLAAAASLSQPAAIAAR